MSDLIVEREHGRMSGDPCFAGTRVLVDSLFVNLAAGQTLERILAAYPSISREVAVAAIRRAGQLLAESAEWVPLAAESAAEALDAHSDTLRELGITQIRLAGSGKEVELLYVGRADEAKAQSTLAAIFDPYPVFAAREFLGGFMAEQIRTQTTVVWSST